MGGEAERERGDRRRGLQRRSRTGRAGAGGFGGKGERGAPPGWPRLTCLPHPQSVPSPERAGNQTSGNCLSLLREMLTEAAGMLTFREVLSRSEGHPEPAFAGASERDSYRVTSIQTDPSCPANPGCPHGQRQPFPTDLKREFSSLWLAPRLRLQPPAHIHTEMAVRRIQTLASPGLVKVIPAELRVISGTGRRRTCDWELQVTLRHLLHLQKLCHVQSLCVHLRVYFGGGNLKSEAINPGLSLPPQLFPHPRAGESIRHQAGSQRPPPSPECLFHPHQGLQGGTPEWSPGAPFPF